jgi:uncharacterized protein YwqG
VPKFAQAIYASDELGDQYMQENGQKYHGQLGGYPNFAQCDIRTEDEYEDSILLFHSNSENSDLMWGDLGYGNFFIQKQDLLNLDFSKVQYTYDCS